MELGKAVQKLVGQFQPTTTTQRTARGPSDASRREKVNLSIPFISILLAINVAESDDKTHQWEEKSKKKEKDYKKIEWNKSAVSDFSDDCIQEKGL